MNKKLLLAAFAAVALGFNSIALTTEAQARGSHDSWNEPFHRSNEQGFGFLSNDNEVRHENEVRHHENEFEQRHHESEFELRGRENEVENEFGHNHNRRGRENRGYDDYSGYGYNSYSYTYPTYSYAYPTYSYSNYWGY